MCFSQTAEPAVVHLSIPPCASSRLSSSCPVRSLSLALAIFQLYIIFPPSSSPLFPLPHHARGENFISPQSHRLINWGEKTCQIDANGFGCDTRGCEWIRGGAIKLCRLLKIAHEHVVLQHKKAEGGAFHVRTWKQRYPPLLAIFLFLVSYFYNSQLYRLHWELILVQIRSINFNILLVTKINPPTHTVATLIKCSNHPQLCYLFLFPLFNRSAT